MGSKGSNTTTSNTSQTSAPDPQAMAAYQQILQRAQGVAQTPYQAYGGEGVAGINAQQNQGISNINQYAGAAQPNINAATSMVQGAANPLTQTQIQSYQNPYTQSVVDATQAQFDRQNNQQAQKLLGNSIAQGSLGGNRSAIGQAELAGQQRTAQAPVIAGLYDKGYQNALQTANQQYQQNPAAQASLLGSLGVAGQNAGLTGAGAQIGAGTLQQGTQQAQNTYNQQQFAQQQAFPYQQTQWLAGIGTGVGSQMGGTTSGTSQTTGPAPNPWSQILGGVTSGIGAMGSSGAFGASGWMAPLMLSDERAKENVRSIGKTHDGQIIYRFNYKGHPQTQIGFLAQEVEKKHPEAVHDIGGVKHVDYDAATTDSIGRASGGVVGFASGGSPNGVAPMPWGNANSYIPTANIAHGSGAPNSSGNAPRTQDTSNDLSKQMSSIGDMAKTLRDGLNGTPATNPDGSIAGASGPTSVGGAPLVGVATPADNFAGGIAPMNRGGVAGFADGGVPTLDDHFGDENRSIGYDMLRKGMGVVAPESIPGGEIAPKGVINPDDPVRMPSPEAVQAWRDGVDNPNAAIRADVDYKQPAPGTPASRGVAPPPPPTPPTPPETATAFSKEPQTDDSLPSEISQGYSASAKKAAGVAAPTPESSSGVEWGADGKLWPSLISAGFGMMASRSPFLGNAIGEGGQAGTHTYFAQKKAEAEAQRHAQQLQLEREKMEKPYSSLTAAQKATVDYQKAVLEHQARSDMRAMMQPIKIGVDALGREIYAVRDPKSGGYNIIDPRTGQLKPQNGVPYAQGNNPLKSTPVTGNGTGQPFGGNGIIQAAEVEKGPLADPKLPQYMKPPEPVRDEEALHEISEGDKQFERTVKKIASYEIDPAKLPQKERSAYLKAVSMYDPSYDQTMYSAKQKAVNEFFAGGPQSPAGTMTAGNTAVLHLSEMYHIAEKLEKAQKEDPTKFGQLMGWVQNQSIPFLSKWASERRNKGAEGTGTDLAMALAEWKLMKTRYTDEVTKFYSGSGGSEGERERSLAVLDENNTPAEMKAAMRQDLLGLRDKVDQLQGRLIQGMNPAAWKSAVAKDPSLVLMYKNSREASDEILKGALKKPPAAPTKDAPAPATAKPSLDEFLAKAQAANPTATREQLIQFYNKKYGQ